MLTHQHTHRSHLAHVSSSTNKCYGMTCHLDKDDKDVQVHKSATSITNELIINTQNKTKILVEKEGLP